MVCASLEPDLVNVLCRTELRDLFWYFDLLYILFFDFGWFMRLVCRFDCFGFKIWFLCYSFTRVGLLFKLC